MPDDSPSWNVARPTPERSSLERISLQPPIVEPDGDPMASTSSIGVSEPALAPQRVTYGAALDGRISYYRSLSRTGQGDRAQALLEPPAAVLKSATDAMRDALLVGVQEGGAASSPAIIFTLWNTMMGSTLLVMPYSFRVGGWALGLGLALCCAALSNFTAQIVLRYGMRLGPTSEFADLAYFYLGRAGWAATLAASIGVCTGAACAMHGYLCRCLINVLEGTPRHGGLGLSHALSRLLGPPSDWQAPVAGIVVVCIFPLVNLPSMRLLARFNALGVGCVMLVLVVSLASAITAGPSPQAWKAESLAQPQSAGAVLGIFSLSFFIQNCVLTIMRASAKPVQNQRNLRIAFVLVLATYSGMGLLANLCPPLGDMEALTGKLAANSFLALPQPASMGGMLLAARIAVIVQATTVYPVLLYVVRAQFFTAFIYRKPYPGCVPVLLLNVALCGVTAFVTAADVNIKDVLRFTGAFASLVCVYVIPALVQWRQSTAAGYVRLLILVGLIGFGTLTVVMQLI